MVDLDGKIVEVSRQYLPEWGGEKVMADPRMELIIGDAYAYLMETTETFDLIIMDISDPIEAGPGIMLYTKEFYEHAVTRLSKPYGMFCTQAGTADAIPSAIVDASGVDPSCFAPIYNTLATVFTTVIPYTTNIPCFGGDWGFIIAQNSEDKAEAMKSKEDWKIPPTGLVDHLIEEHITGGASALKFYDGTTHIHMFALTKTLRAYISKDDRVMTKDNPIFMY